MTEKTTQGVSRPLSPHLQVYQWHIMMFVSIMHRVTGAALALGTVLLVGWLWAAAYNPDCFTAMNRFLGSIVGRAILFAWSLAFYFHLCNGLRHLVWDSGKGFEVRDAERSAWAVMLFSAILTLITWFLLLKQGGAQ